MKRMVNFLLFCGVMAFALSACAAHQTNAVAHNTTTTKAVHTKVVVAKVNINKADVKTLRAVKGITYKRAKEIVAYRTKHGQFKSVDDLINVKGMTKKQLKKVCEHLTV